MSRREAQQRFKVISSMIRPEFPATPEGQLFAGVVLQAIEDVMVPRSKGAEPHDRTSAFRYLAGDMWHAHKAGVDPDWIREILFRVGFPDDTCTESGRYNNTGHAKAKARQSRLLAQAVGYARQKRAATAGLS